MSIPVLSVDWKRGEAFIVQVVYSSIDPALRVSVKERLI